MAYIYRYTDLEDNIIKYVGIVWSDNRTLLQRIREHNLNDEWCKNKKWKIEFLTENINTRTDAEYFESHYISLFGTYKYYNKSKAGWGVSSFLPNKEKDWKVYTDKLFNDNFIFKVSIKDDSEFYIETIPITKKMCKTKNISDYKDYHCKCGSNELYKEERGVGQLYCKECGSWVVQCSKDENSLYTPEYNGKYTVDDNGEILMYEYYSFCNPERYRCNYSKNFIGYKKDELKNNIINESAYALNKSEIEDAKLRIVKYENKIRQLKLSRINNEIENLKKELEEHKENYNNFKTNFNLYLN